jgi:hypothetical protein
MSQLASANRNPRRLGGGDQYATSRAVLQESIARGLPTNQVFVTDGNNILQEPVVGAGAGRIGGLQLATRGGSTAEAQSVLAGLGLQPKLDRIITPAQPRPR